MLDFFAAISNFVSALGSVLINLISGIGQVLALIPKGFVLLTYLYGLMPPVLLVFATAGISLCVVMMIVDR